MARFTFIFIIFAYIFPFSLVASGYIFEFIQVIITISAFFIGYISIQVNKPPVNYNSFFIIKPFILYSLFIIYIILKISFINDFITAMSNNNILAWMKNNAVDRYAGNNTISLVDRLSSTVYFVYPLVLGTFKIESKNKNLFLMYFLMLSIDSLTLARAGVLISLTVYFSQYLFFNNYHFCKVGFSKYLKYYTIAILFLSCIFMFSFFFRVYDASDIVGIFQRKIGPYTLAIYQALYAHMEKLEWYSGGNGINTFSSVYKIFGVEQDQGFYEKITTMYGSTNIYTNIRGLYDDFSIIGTAIFFYFTGFFIKKISYFKTNIFGYFVASFLLLIILFPLYSPFIFFNVLSAYILYFIFLFCLKIKL